MTLDKEDHRTILLELINKAAFPGQFAETVVELKTALVAAEVVKSDQPLDIKPFYQPSVPL
jgi:hypothetical protein